LKAVKDNTGGGTVQTYHKVDGTLHSELKAESQSNIMISKPDHFSMTDDAITAKGLQGIKITGAYKLIPIPYHLTVYLDIICKD